MYINICKTSSAFRGVGNSRSWSIFLTVQARHPVRFARWRGFSSSKWIHYLGVETEIRLPGFRKTIFLRNTSVLGVRALNNVGTWVTYWKRWLYVGSTRPLLIPSFIPHSFLPTSAYVFFPLSYRLPSILFTRSTWSAQPYKLPTIPYLSDLHSRTILARAVIPPLILRVYTDRTMCV